MMLVKSVLDDLFVFVIRFRFSFRFATAAL